MIKKFTLSVLLFAGLVVGIFAFNTIPETKQSGDLTLSRNDLVIPEHVIYRHLFHDIVALNEKADEMERQGQSAGLSLRTVYKRRAELTEDQARVLYEIALNCEQQVNAQDAKAKVIIDAYKSRYPGGRVPAGETPAPPSPELVGMQAERNAIILRSRDRLREIFGDAEFERFKGFLEHQVAPKIRPVSNDQLTRMP